MSAPDEVRLARAYLVRVAEPPAPALAALVELLGPVEAAGRVRAGEVPAPVVRETTARRALDLAERDLGAAAEVGARLVVPEDPDWPTEAFTAFALSGCDHLAVPLALWVRGRARLGELTGRSVALVGSRASTEYGVRVAFDLAHGVAELGCTVFSGAAHGVDGAAHRGALTARGPTAAVLALGVDRYYPAAHERLLEQIADEGLVISEYPPGAIPARHRFLVRNRLIAGLAGGTVVVEAARRSGARRTASDAALLGRPVMAVPGSIYSVTSVGCHRLLREPGTIAVGTADEVLEEVGRIGLDLAAEGPPVPARDAAERLPSSARRIYESLGDQGPSEPARLVVESGLPPGLVSDALHRLEQAGLATRVGRTWRRGGA